MKVMERMVQQVKRGKGQAYVEWEKKFKAIENRLAQDTSCGVPRTKEQHIADMFRRHSRRILNTKRYTGKSK